MTDISDDDDYDAYSEGDNDLLLSGEESLNNSDVDPLPGEEDSEESEEEEPEMQNESIFDASSHNIPADFIKANALYRRMLSSFYRWKIKEESNHVTRFDNGEGGVVIIPKGTITSKAIEDLASLGIRERVIVLLTHQDLTKEKGKKTPVSSTKKKKNFSQIYTTAIRNAIHTLYQRTRKVVFILSAYNDLSVDLTLAKEMVPFIVLSKEDQIDGFLYKNVNYLSVAKDLGFDLNVWLGPHEMELRQAIRNRLLDLSLSDLRRLFLKHSPLPSRPMDLPLYRLFLIEEGTILYTDYREIHKTNDKLDTYVIVRDDPRN